MEDNHGAMDEVEPGVFRCKICRQEIKLNPLTGRAQITKGTETTALHSGGQSLFNTGVKPEASVLDKKDLNALKSYEDYLNELLKED